MSSKTLKVCHEPQFSTSLSFIILIKYIITYEYYIINMISYTFTKLHFENRAHTKKGKGEKLALGNDDKKGRYHQRASKCAAREAED